MNRERIASWYEQYKVGLYRFALSVMKSENMAEDILQEVFLRLLSGRYTPEPGKEKAYLYRAVRNLCYDELRKKKWKDQELKPQFGVTENYAYIELIAPLEKREQEIVTLKIVGGLSHREIGKVMGITEQAAKKRYQRAIEKLREG